ncbi:helix-turn-helix transcriptional regulator [Tissierella sp. MSJ-40]|uniref:Helix-turn-helix transcriptional regulator n=1 Tax=Tissierella simiarum TaxID=2841534 RepID=A0ABS6E243_9FIRM|nr:helix-turn-helix transcriptional regulator [Tissierella simiarum]MBU5436963.1 helix-turn-helix transcriptional regulator [Tissierella simiarum]
MVKYNDLSIGENLKRIRQELDLKQYEITGGEVTRNLISIIENNKTPLTENNAKLICRNINKIMEDKGLDIIIDPEDIFNPDRYEAKKQADLYIEELDKLLSTKNYSIETEYVSEIELFLNKWNLTDKKIRIYEILGDIYKDLRDYTKGYHYYIKGWECVFNYPDRKLNYRLMKKLIANCIIIGKYREAINLFDYVLVNRKNIPDKDMVVFHYNNALAYEYLNLIDESLEQITESLRYIEKSNYRDLGKILILEGNCYFEIENYDEALKSYNKAVDALSLGNYYDELLLLYANMAEVYIKINFKNKSIEYINKVLDNITKLNKDSNYFSKLCNQIATAYNHLNEFDLAEKYYNESLVYAKKNNQHNVVKENILGLFNIYYNKLDNNKIHKLFEDYRDVILNISLDNDILLMLKSLEFYITNKNEIKALELIETLIINNEGGKKDEN